MPVFSTIGTVFFEMTLTVVSVIAFAVLAKEYAVRRTRSLLFYSLAFLTQAFAAATTFGGQVLAANGHDQTAIDALRMSSAFTSVGGVFLAAAYFSRYKKDLWWLMTGCTAVLAASSICMLVAMKPMATQANGVTFIFYTAWQLCVIYSPLFFALLGMVIRRSSALARLRGVGERQGPADRMMLNAGLFGMLFNLMVILAVVLQTASLVVPSMAAYLAFLFLTFMAALTEDHPEKAVRLRPYVLFRKSLMLKAVGMNVIAIWLLSIGMLAVIASSFVEGTMNARHVAMQRDLRYFVQAVKLRQFAQIDEANRFAEMSRTVSVLGGVKEDVPVLRAELNELASPVHGTRVFDLVDRDSRILFSTRADAAIGGFLVDSHAIARALSGRGHASIEKDDAFGLWVLRAAEPIMSSDGSVRGAAIVTDVDSAFNFNEYLSVAPISSSGYGYVSDSGDAVFSAGPAVDSSVRDQLRYHVLPGGISFYDDGENSFFLERTFDSDGEAHGYFYTVVANRTLDAEAFRIISLVALLTLFAVMLITALLLFSMTVTLRPIRELRTAAVKVEREEYDHRVKYGSPDEVGQLASAFNHMLEAIGERTQALRAAVRERHDFLDHATRELRVPLNVFRWTLDAMRFGDTGRLNKEQMELIERLHQTSQRLSNLFRDLQDVMLIDRGRVALHKAPVALEDVVDAVAGQVAVEARKKGVELKWARPAEPAPKVSADAVYVEKVLLNLVTNAVKYTLPKGFVEIRVSQEMAVRHDGKKGGFVKVIVKDSGIGIPAEDTKRIFTRFFRATNITGFEVEGTGLGLYMAKRLVELHGGRITIESREGVGTTVAVSFPTEDDQSPENGIAVVNA